MGLTPIQIRQAEKEGAITEAELSAVLGRDSSTSKPITPSQSLQAIHDSRSELSKSSDERQEHSLVVEPDDPRVERWMRDPGTMDVRGIDTPSGVGKKRAKKAKAKPRRKVDNPTSIRRIGR